MSETVSAALAYARAGLCPIPIRIDGSKAPWIKEWKSFQTAFPSDGQIRGMFRWDCGIALLGGNASGGMEWLDLDDKEIGDGWRGVMREHHADLLASLVIVETPRPGFHVGWRNEGFPTPGSDKLAWRPLTTEEIASGQYGKATKKALAETKGEGGYVLAPGGDLRAHELKKPYRFIQNDYENVPRLQPDERDVILSVARMFDRMPHVVATQRERKSKPPDDDGLLPGDDYEERGDWFRLLEDAGWVCVGRSGDVTYWMRPGKSHGQSATLGYCRGSRGEPLLRVFSSSTDFPVGAIGLFNAYALLHWNNNHSDAARALAEQGYGRQATVKRQKGKGDTKPTAGAGRRDGGGVPGRKLRPYVAFPVHLLPVGMREIVEAAARAIHVDPALVALPALAVAASCIGATFTITPDRGVWVEDCCLWAVPVCESGARKTPAYKAAMRHLNREQGRIKREYKQRKCNYENALESWESADKRDRGEKPQKPPPMQVLFTSDGTIEGLTAALDENSRGILYAASEVDAWFQSLSRYNQQTAPYFLALYNAEAATSVRASRETISLERPILSVSGTIQPVILAGVMTVANVFSGLMGRILFAMPDRVKGVFDPDADFSGEMEDWVEVCKRLLALSFAADPEDDQKPNLLSLTDPARDYFGAWYNALETRLFEAAAGPATIADHKLAGNCLRLALVFHLTEAVADAAKDPLCPVGIEVVKNACALADWFSVEHRRMYDYLDSGAAADTPTLADRILSYFAKRPGTTSATLAQLQNALKDREGTVNAQSLTESLKELEAAGHGTIRVSKGTTGRNVTIFTIKTPEPVSDVIEEDEEEAR